MNRIVGLALLIVFGFVAAAAWLAEQPGAVTITWGEASSEVGLTAAVVLLMMALAGTVLLVDALRWLLRIPKRRAERRAREKERAGWRAAADTVLAVAGGDRGAAETANRTAAGSLPAEPLVQLGTAQRAQWAGDHPAAAAAFKTLTAGQRSAAVGWRGLMVEARRTGDTAEALRAAREGLERTGLPWAADAVVELTAFSGDLDGALTALEDVQKRQLVDKARAKRWKAVLLTGRAMASALDDPDGTRRRVTEALSLAPDLVPAAALSARLARPKGARAMMAILADAWKRGPHPDLMALALSADTSPEGAEARAIALAKLAPEHPESRIGVARAAILAGDRARAASSLEPLTAGATEQRVAVLLAELERAAGRHDSAHEWMLRALTAQPDPAWMADGRPLTAWAPVSPFSGTLDGVTWGRPPSPEAVAVPEGDDQAVVRRLPALVEGKTEAAPAMPPEGKRTSVPTAAGRPPAGSDVLAPVHVDLGPGDVAR